MKFNGVSKKYGNTVALDHLDLEIEKGKITAVLGESGAGKTTLLNVAAALTDYEGSVEGAERISYLFQNSCLLPHLSAEENVKFVLGKTEQGGVGETLARVGLQGKEKRYPRELSGGEQRRVSIARALLFPHDTLLMDEPFSSLDISTKKTLLELISQLCREREETVLFVTHDVREAVFLASRAVVLKNGRAVKDVPIPAAYPRDFFARYPEEETLEKALLFS